MATPSRRTLALLITAVVAAATGVATYAAGAWNGVEARTLDARFSLRPAHRPNKLLVVAIDDYSIDGHHAWPFPRSWHAAAIDRLRADGARTIVYDVQFTESTVPREDNALFAAVRRAGNVVLATSEVDAQGHHDVLGGAANVAQARARVGAANLPADPGPVIRRYSRTALGLPSLAVAAAETSLGHALAAGDFGRRGAWIDFPGPPGTIATVHFWDLIKGRVPASLVAGRTVVVGATSPTLGDVHSTSVTGGAPMAGPEVQAAAIWTAMHGNPLRSAPGWLALVSIVLGALAAPLLCWLVRRPVMAAGGAVALAVGYLVGAQAAFMSGLIVVVVYPLVALAAGAVGTVVVSYGAEARERRRMSAYAWRLERRVRRGRRELRAAQLEVVERLVQAAESRDEQTGGHVQRIGELCHVVGLALGMSQAEALLLRHASTMHDVGKIGIPDSVLLKAGPLDPDEWEVMKSHTTRGAAILTGSSSPMLQMAESIALTHHERWDGSGYPAGLSGEDIPLVGRITAVCDVYDALVSRRPYKEPWTHEAAIAEMRTQSGRHFDPRVLEAFLESVSEVARVDGAVEAAEPVGAEPEGAEPEAPRGDPGRASERIRVPDRRLRPSGPPVRTGARGRGAAAPRG